MTEYEKIILAEKNSKKLIYGIPFNITYLENNKVYRLYNEKKEFLAIGEKTPEKIVILKTFY